MTGRPIRDLAAAAGTAIALALATPAFAATYGLQIGVNDYIGRSNDLGGAVNDAEDIAAALRNAGAVEVVVLTDAAATKDAIEAEWRRLVATAAPGDTIVFSFAGHGSQEPEPEGRRGEGDGLNESFVLAGYQSIGEASRERIVDDEVFAWLSLAEDRGIEVIFVADSCHSGTMYRAIEAPGVRYRLGNFEPPTETDLPEQRYAEIEETDFARVTFIGATQEDRLTPELIIDGVPRGALSWAFARAIEGAADRDGDGAITQFELLDYLIPAVEVQAQHQQTPSILPFSPEPKRLLTIGTSSDTAVLTPRSAPVLRVFAPEAWELPAIAGIERVSAREDADLIWSENGNVDHAIAGRVAVDVDQDAISGLLEKWTALGTLQGIAADLPFAMRLLNGNFVHLPGEVLTIELAGAARPYLTLFNLAPNGRVELLLPADGDDALVDWRGVDTSVQVRVADPPYGGEHLIAILTDEPALSLHAALGSMAERRDSTGLASLIAAFADANDIQAGILGIYTAAE